MCVTPFHVCAMLWVCIMYQLCRSMWTLLQHVSGTGSHFSSISFGQGDDAADRSDRTVQQEGTK